MRDIILNKKSINLESIKSYVKNDFMLKPMLILFGILASRGTIFGRYFPFGLSLVSAYSGTNAIYTLIGVIIGYIFQINTSSSVRYISTAIAIMAIKWTLSDLKKIKNHKLYVPLITFVPTFLTGIALNSVVDGFEYSDISISLIEALFASGASYFFNMTFKIIDNRKSIMRPKEMVCILTSISIMLLSLVQVKVGELSLGRILAVLLIFLCCLCTNIQGGSVAGISTGIVMSLSTFGLLYTSSSYAFGGMMAGFFSYFGRLSIIIAFLCSHILISFQSGDISYLVVGVYEIILGAIIFLFIPQSFISRLKEISFYPERKVQNIGFKNSISQRLKFASESLLSVSDFVDKVSVKLEKVNSPEIRDICKNAVYCTCNNCNLKTLCWENDRKETIRNFSDITRFISYGKEIDKDSFPEKFTKRCLKIDQIIYMIKENYKNYTSKLASRNRLKEFRSILSGQFDSVGCLLKNMASEFENVEIFEQDKAFKIKQRLKNFDIDVCNVVCQKNKDDRVTIEIDMPVEYREKFVSGKSVLVKELSNICGKNLDEPAINIVNNTCMVQVSERTVFKVQIKIKQHACNDGKLCGDNYVYFNDGNGNLVVIISDGMGTGGKAAVDGAIASELMGKLIKSGIDFESSIKIVNSALIVKSEEESLATLDVLSLNLFTGNAKFMKAGAPSSFVKRGRNIEKIELSSLPIGIFNETTFLYDNVKLDNNDVILMLSDGVTDVGDEWIEEKLKTFDGDDIEKFTYGVIDETIEKRKELRDDDITAITIKMMKNGKQ